MSEGLPRLVIDACVLANYSVCDLLLRLAEPPALYEPKWTDEIIAETVRTLEHKLFWPADLVVHFESQLRKTFPQSLIRGHEPLIARMTNDPKDRHVAAAAAASGVPTIVTFNLRHFKSEDLSKWSVAAVHPQQILI